MQSGVRRTRAVKRVRRRGGKLFFTRLSRYLMAEITVPALLALVVIAFVGVGNELRERSEALPIGLIGAKDIVQLVALFMPTLVSYIVAVAYMIGILMAFGALGQRNEFTAIKAAGIPLKRLLVPVITCGALLSVLVFMLHERVQPWAWQRINTLLYEELPQRATLEVLPVGVMHEFGNLRVYVRDRDRATKTLYDIDINLREPDGKRKVFYAKSAQFEENENGMVLRLQDGHGLIPSGDDTITRMILNDFPVPLPGPEGQRAPSYRRTMDLRQLFEEENRLLSDYETAISEGLPAAQRQDRRTQLLRARIEIAERLTLPLATLAVSVVAAPLALRSNRGGRSYSFAIGFVVIIAFYLMRALLESSSLKPLSEVVLRGLAPSIILAFVGIWAIWRVDRV